MKLSDFDFDLPKDLIAQKPSPERGESRLLVLDRSKKTVEHTTFSALPDYLDHAPVMVFNDTRVLPAKLAGNWMDSGKTVEILLVREETPGTWQVLMKDLKKFQAGQRLTLGDGALMAEFAGRHQEYGRIRFLATEDLTSRLETLGKMPLPHYIHRSMNEDPETDARDRERYQTVFAREPGAIAAPTAGLHFTREMIQRINTMTDAVYLTLHVGPGTFQPVRVDEVEDHRMQEEYFNIPVDSWNALWQAKKNARKILAVGTTSTRVLETVHLDREEQSNVSGWSDRFLYPGQTFRNTDHLLTNFHLPKSTLYMLACAFAGSLLLKNAYEEAIQARYRFFSYGDAMLIL